MPERSTSTDSYRYAYNGMEMDNEVSGGKGTSYDFGARMYDARLARWNSQDPLKNKYVSFSPYNYAINSPLLYMDYDGRDIEITIIKNETTGETVMNITLSGKVSFDHYSTTVGLKRKQKYVKTVNEKLAAMYSKTFESENLTVNFISKMELGSVEYKEDHKIITEEDHVIYITNFSTGEYAGFVNGDEIGGFVNQIGGKSAYFPKSLDKSDETLEHEIGHWLGLTHPKHLAWIVSDAAEWYEDVPESGDERFSGYTYDQAYYYFSSDNLMHHPTDKNVDVSNGGQVEYIQFLIIQNVYDDGYLNNGNNDFNIERKKTREGNLNSTLISRKGSEVFVENTDFTSTGSENEDNR